MVLVWLLNPPEAHEDALAGVLADPDLRGLVLWAAFPDDVDLTARPDLAVWP